MIILMYEDLKLTVEPPEDENILPDGWFYDDDMDVTHEGELDVAGRANKSRWGDTPTDLYDDGLVEEFKHLQRAGVRGELHLTDSCGPRYIRIFLDDDGVKYQSGEVKWTSKTVLL